MERVIILGAKGRFGRAATEAFLKAGWEVTAFARGWKVAPLPGVRQVTGDVRDAEALIRHCQGQQVIVNAINPPYEKWASELPRITPAVIAAAKDSGATVMLPGNVYNYGAGMPSVLKEGTPWQPTTRKGRLRVEMECAYRDAGVRTIVLRGGDFIEAAKTGNWFDTYIATHAHKGKTMYPGPLNRVHAWAYLPDMARAMVALAERRDDFGPFEEFGFEGFNLTGAELVAAIEAATGKPQKRKHMPWLAIRLMGLFSAPMREVLEMRYLWKVPHAMDGEKFASVVPDFAATPVVEALRIALAQQNQTKAAEMLSFSEIRQ